MTINKKTASILEIVGVIVLACLFCLKFSLTTSPFYNIQGQDSACFYLFGKYWSEGFLPYISLWDHKGPLIFFINLIGYTLTGSKIGVLIIQCISLSVFLYFTLRTFRLYFPELVSWGLTAITLCWLACSYEGGNLTEEYLLPFLSMGFYQVCHWLDQRETQDLPFPSSTAFLFGLILGFSFLTRLTNALSSCGAMLGIGLLLIGGKQWRNLLRIILYYILGFVVIVLPFCLYFYFHEALDDMLYGTLLYNITFLDKSYNGSILSRFMRKDFLLFTIMAVNCYGLLFLSLINLFSKSNDRKRALVWLCSSALLAIWYLNGNMDAHYRTITVPFFPVLMAELYRSRQRFPRILVGLVSACLLLGPTFQTFRKWNSFVDYYNDEMILSSLREYVMANVPDRHLEDFVGYNCLTGIYLALDVQPCYSHFSFQRAQTAKSTALRDDVLREFGSKKARYILVNGDASLIQSVLDESYQAMPSNRDYPLYKLYIAKDRL